MTLGAGGDAATGGSEPAGPEPSAMDPLGADHADLTPASTKRKRARKLVTYIRSHAMDVTVVLMALAMLDWLGLAFWSAQFAAMRYAIAQSVVETIKIRWSPLRAAQAREGDH